MATSKIYQLKITLKHIKPAIWRRIQIPDNYTFWDLHSAIQDAFGWTNSHMHQFIYTDAHTDGEVNKPSVFGIPLEPEYEDDPVILPGWNYKIKYYIEGKTSQIEYVYDLGDYWQHSIELEEVLEREKGFKYPFCMDGERACPPEDCGGPHGYENILEILSNPKDEEYEDTMVWYESITGRSFKPEQFYPAQVKFAKPGWRLRKLFED